MSTQNSRPRPRTHLQHFDPANIDPNKNPFKIPDDRKILAQREAEAEVDRRLSEQQKKTKLMIRNCPGFLPSLRRPSTLGVTDSTDNPTVQPVGPEHQCREELHHFVGQRREIFLVQLFIDRKLVEVERIQQQEESDTKAIIDQKAKLLELENQYRMNRNQEENDMIRARRVMEAAIRRRASLANALKKKRAEIEAMEYDLFCNEEQVESRRRYDRFLQKFDEKYDRAAVYKDPNLLLGELEYLENDNLTLITRCHEMSGKLDRNVTRLSADIESAEHHCEEIRKYAGTLDAVRPLDTRRTQIARETDVLDRELSQLSKLVEKYFVECFKKTAAVSALEMLSKLEAELEHMYRCTESLSPQFLVEKQQAIEKARRETQRRKKQEQRAIDQQKKVKAAIDRSKQPIHQRTGRPLNARVLPCIVNRRDVDMKQYEGELQEQMLYGPLAT
jgi:hypothetical protein